jgi:histidine kinase-like protein
MHRGQQAAPAGARLDSGLARLDGGFALGESAIPPGLLPLPIAGPPGRALPSAAAEPATPHAAREFTREVLRQWDLCVIYPDASVVVSELVTNALCYGARVAAPPQDSDRGPVDLTLWQRASYLICVVADGSPEPPVLQPVDPTAEAGRGLQVVQALSSSWGWTMLGGRQKAVWAALSLPGSRGGPAWPDPAHPALLSGLPGIPRPGSADAAGAGQPPGRGRRL